MNLSQQRIWAWLLQSFGVLIHWDSQFHSLLSPFTIIDNFIFEHVFWKLSKCVRKGDMDGEKTDTCVGRGDMYSVFVHCSLLPHPRVAGPEPHRSEHTCSTMAMCGVQWDQNEVKDVRYLYGWPGTDTDSLKEPCCLFQAALALHTERRQRRSKKHKQPRELNSFYV